MNKLKLFVLKNILLPGGLLPLQIFEQRYINLLKDTILREPIGIIQPKTDSDEDENPALYGMGCSGRIVRMEEIEAQRFFVLVRGEKRFHYIEDSVSERGYKCADIRWVLETTPADEAGQYIENREEFMQYLREHLKSRGINADLSEIETTKDMQLINTLSLLMPLPASQKQRLLEAMSIAERLQILQEIIGQTSSNFPNKPSMH